MKLLWCLALWIVTACAMPLSLAQTYPAKTILMIMPLQAASSVDVGMRIVTQKMIENMGQQIVIENQPGAAGLIGTERFMRSTPDGYTLATLNDSILTMIPHLYKKVAYDANKSFAPVSLVAGNTWLLVVHPTLPVKSARELVTLAKARPNELNYSSGGNGSPQHIAMEMFKSMTGAKLTHIPYKGTTQATLDVISGQIPLMFSATSLVISQVREGRLRALAAGGAKRSALFPAVPTVAESGVPGYEFQTWMAIFAPLNTSKEIISRLNAEILKALSAPDVREKLVSIGFELEGSSPEKLAAVTKARFEQMQKIIKDAAISID
ncbi:MAG: Bug family tripartite tricarboxylate transporter substrate binding protein [Burkholderiales bacterium]